MPPTTSTLQNLGQLQDHFIRQKTTWWMNHSFTIQAVVHIGQYEYKFLENNCCKILNAQETSDI